MAVEDSALALMFKLKILIMKKPITPAMHGTIDYVMGTALFAAPTLLGINQKAARNYRRTASLITALNAMTDTPAGIRKMVPMKVHQAADASVLAGLALATTAKSVRTDKKALIFHCAFFAMALTQYMLTDYNG
jgi:hypothetical protein